MKNDYDFIKDKFDNDNIKAPDNINEENVTELIKDKEPKRIKLVNTKAFKAVVSAAACLVVVLLAFGVMQPQLADDKAPEKTANNNSASAITAFSDYKEIKAYIKSSFNNADEYANYGAGIKGAYGIATEETADGVSVDTLSENISYADTYKQVDSVDEADVIKTDGKYIYYIDDFDNTLGIYKADKSATLISTIEDFNDGNDTDTQYFGLDMFLYGNSLIVTCEEANYEDGDYENYVGAYVYDVSNPKKPKLTKRYKQSGCYVSSRMIGERLYVVSNKYVYPRCKNIKEYIPYGMSENGVLEPLSAKDICCINNSSEPNYIVVSDIDVENEDKQTETKAILGAGEQIYCNEKNMYVAGASYEYLENNNEIADVAFYNSTTRLVKISLENGIEFTAEGKINGNLNNQFSMDEKDGYLRVATTSNDKNGNEINNLYVLDSDLKNVGEVTGFAKDESIRAVKFLGDTAYVITYEQTDPLFVIDLSDPKAPEIKGSVKISGFSTMLMPVDENTILGIGYSDEEREYGIVTNGLKLALFDISDSANPRVLDSKEFIGYESQVQYNHKALVINKEQGYYAIPYAEYNSEASAKAGILTFEITDREINMTENFKTLNSGYTCPRCTYVNDTLYLFNGYEDVTAFIK
ncbi:MAG: beta-propeller domain-containing protein [Eubacteriales bacterium]|nr:beta-propeller domain-containing protein [Eubacteriales bacterium]